jgi:nitroimidazol reductase NimA-like FMN-containing flavoprotein (pyridoxamine 5'-phosphate oxidase superfamily)
MSRTDALNYVRRRDRNVEDEAWIIDFLQRGAIGVLATVDDGQPFINSNLYVYDDARDCIYMHTAKHGRTRTNLDQPEARVCFSIMEIGRLLPAPTAKNFSVEYAGVVVFGTGCVIEDPDEAKHALQILMDKYAAHLTVDSDYAAPTYDDLKTTAVYRINIESWSGKKKEVADDFPGAYWYQPESMLSSVHAR